MVTVTVTVTVTRTVTAVFGIQSRCQQKWGRQISSSPQYTGPARGVPAHAMMDRRASDRASRDGRTPRRRAPAGPTGCGYRRAPGLSGRVPGQSRRGPPPSQRAVTVALPVAGPGRHRQRHSVRLSAARRRRRAADCPVQLPRPAAAAAAARVCGGLSRRAGTPTATSSSRCRRLRRLQHPYAVACRN